MWVVAILIVLLPPMLHQYWGHSDLRRLVSGHPVPRTEHEQKHAARTATQRHAADAGWLLYMAGVIALAIMLH